MPENQMLSTESVSDSDTDRWYVAVLILECEVLAPSDEGALIDHQLRLIRAADADTAYQRAQFVGRSEETEYKNPDGRQVRWRFRGLHDLTELKASDITDGVEVYSFRLRAERALEVLPKEQLTVFWLDRLRDTPVAKWFE
jgi:hypothetical protein